MKTYEIIVFRSRCTWDDEPHRRARSMQEVHAAIDEVAKTPFHRIEIGVMQPFEASFTLTEDCPPTQERRGK